MADDKAFAYNVFAWLFNVSTSIAIVFVNKVLMGANGYMFNFAVTLCALHFISCSVGLTVMKMLGLTQSSGKTIPWSDRIMFAVAANISIASLNLSLMVNSVGFYQIAKLLIIPFTAVVQSIWLKESLTLYQTACTAVVLLGVAIVTVSDVTSSKLGVFIAAVSVASSSMQQILCRYYLKKHDVASNELLGTTAPLQGWSLLLIGPFVDLSVGSRWILSYEFTVAALICLLLSCGIAVAVNISQFMCLGRFSAVTFQVTGHAKTVMVLLGSALFLHEQMQPRQVLGMALAVIGMIAYGYFSSQGAKPGPTIAMAGTGSLKVPLTRGASGH
eukprot:jgi/Ulvmu1/10262/UM060_0063.1